MSMKADQENFEQLRRLLALKKHEQPPPGYFNDFSQQVIMHIRAAGPGEESLGLETIPWLQRFWATLEHNPLLAGAFGVLVCALLLSGVIFSERAGAPDVNLVDSPQDLAAVTDVSTSNHPLLAQPVQTDFSSTAGVPSFESRGSLFATPSHAEPLARPVMFSVPGDN